MAKRMWVFNPRRGGQKISPHLQEQVRRRILDHAAKVVPAKASQVQVRFSRQFCYIDAVEPDSEYPMHLCRLRYLGLSGWSMAFYTYSHEKYEECIFASGSFVGTPEEAFEIGAVYLQ